MIIICKHGTTKKVLLNRPRESGIQLIDVDYCIADEIQMLNDKGVITYGCCCGHGDINPHCLVDIQSKELLQSLGYELRSYSEMHSEQGVYEILLKIKSLN